MLAVPLTVQSHVVVGEDGRLVPFGGPPDDHMQHPIRGLDVVFLQGGGKHATPSHTCGGSSSPCRSVPDLLAVRAPE